MPKSKNTRNAVQQKKARAKDEARFATLPYSTKRKFLSAHDPVAAWLAEERRAAEARSGRWDRGSGEPGFDLGVLASLLSR